MMIDDDHVRLRRLAAGLEQEALAVHRALRASAHVGLRGDFVPQLRARRRREVAERPISRALGPCMQRVELLLDAILGQRIAGGARLIETCEAEIVTPSLEQREANLLVAQRGFEKWQVLADQLLLE